MLAAEVLSGATCPTIMFSTTYWIRLSSKR